MRYSDTGAFIDVFVSAASGGLDGPSDTHFRDGLLLVVSARSDSVIRYNGATGDFVDVLVEPGSGGLDYPHHMQIDGDVLYLAGTPNNDILKFDADSGSFLGTLVPSGGGGLNGPRGLLIVNDCRDSDGDNAVGPADLAALLGSWGPCE